VRYICGYPIGLDPPAGLLTQQAVGAVAATAEAAGFGAFSLTEHPATPERWRDNSGHDAIDPFVGLAFAAAATHRIQLLTYLAVLPYHRPFALAKTVATLDRLSGGRFILGAGTGYLRGEFEALGVDFDARNTLFDQSVEAMRAAWTGLPVSLDGIGFAAREVVGRPAPATLPHPPIWIGGNSALTRRRVAEWGQGWMPIPTTGAQSLRRHTASLTLPGQLKEWIAELQEHRERLGRLGPAEVSFMIEDVDPRAQTARYLERVHELENIGVGWISLQVPGRSRAETEDYLAWFGDAVIAPTRQPGTDVPESAAPPTAGPDVDRAAIVGLYHGYADLIGRREFNRLADIFTTDVHARYCTQEIAGLAALTNFMTDSHRDIGEVKHWIVDVEVEIRGEVAVARAAKRNILRMAGSERPSVVAGRYLDDLVRTPDGWRIRRRASQHAPRL
jgi:probable F420-dependent oxidoreductase